MIDVDKLVFCSLFSGLSNNNTVSFSTTFSGGNISPGQYKLVRASAPLDNSNDISQVIFQLTGFESFYRLLNGVTQVDYPNSGSRTYSIETFSYSKNGIVYVDCYVINQGGTTLSAPSFTLTCLASTFVAPF